MHWLKRTKSRLLFKYIVSYLLVFLIPFMLMSAFIYYSSVYNLREEIEQSNINKLKQVENITNERIKELEKIATNIAYDPRLTPYMMKHNYYSGEAIEELKKYKSNSSIIEDLFVYYYENDHIYTLSGSFSLDTFTQRMYKFDKEEQESLINDLYITKPMLKTVGNVTLNNGTQDRIIAFLYPIVPNSLYPYGTVMYFIKEKVLTDLTQNILGNFQGNTYIFDENNQKVASSINVQEISEGNLNLTTINDQEIRNVEINGKEYSLVSVKSEISGWTFITLMDTDQFLERVFHMRTFIITILIFLLFVGIIIAVLFGSKQYKPIRKLFELTQKSDKQNVEIMELNEFENIGNTIAKAFLTHQSLNETIFLQKPFAKEQLLINLLKGDLRDNKEIDALMHALNVVMRDDCYFVTIVYFDKMKEKENFLQLLSKLTIQDAAVHGVDLIYNDALALIISMNQDPNKAVNQRRILVSQIQQYIQETTVINPTVAVGKMYEEKSYINRSYIEALAAIEYKFAVPQGSIIYFEEISSQSERGLGYPVEDQIKLAQSLKQGDHIVATETLRDMFTRLAKEELSIQVLKCICFDIINTVMKTASEMELTKYIDDFNSIVDFNSIKQLEEQLCEVAIKICKKVESKKRSNNEELRNDVLEYIKVKYKMFDLSLESIAINFHLTLPYLSRFIKDQTGSTFTEYVLKLRMEDVKRKLKDTDWPIKKIVLDVGYKDVSNFTRKFREREGIPPGEYRKLNRK